MFLSLQFPFADSRGFIDKEIKLLGRPNWPTASPDVDFVRSFGSIRRRRRGGVSGWVGEGTICEADRALRFKRLSTFKDSETRVPLGLAFRRFYFDGLAVGKFEIGLISKRTESLTTRQTRDFIAHVLGLQVLIPALSPKAVSGELAGKSVLCPLAQAGRGLARFYAASSIKHPPAVSLKDWWVVEGTPVLFLIHDVSERIQLPPPSRKVPRNEKLNCDLSYCEVPYHGRTFGMWVMGLTETPNYPEIRALRICLLRLHAEHEALRLVLENIATDDFRVVPRSPGSNLLQLYLNEATRRISRLGSEADSMSDGSLAELARVTEDVIKPGDREALLVSLKKIDVRLNILRKVERYVDAKIYAQEVVMGDQFKVNDSQVGAVGPNADIHHNLFNQWQDFRDGVDLARLAEDLSVLRAELKKRGNEPEHDAAAGEIAAAEIAARKNDGPTALIHLKNAGVWALEVAKSITVPVAVEVLKRTVAV